MTSTTNILVRLQAAPEELLDAILNGRAAIDEFNDRWQRLHSDIEQADRMGRLDEDISGLVVSVSSTLRELADSFESLESEFQDIKEDLGRNLQHVLSSQEANSVSGPHHSTSTKSAMSPAYQWLLNNPHNPYPSKDERKHIASLVNSDVAKIASFFKRIREKSGWNRILQTYFNGDRRAAVAAARNTFMHNQFDKTATVFQPTFRASRPISDIPPRCLVELKAYQSSLLADYKKILSSLAISEIETDTPPYAEASGSALGTQPGLTSSICRKNCKRRASLAISHAKSSYNCDTLQAEPISKPSLGKRKRTSPPSCTTSTESTDCDDNGFDSTTSNVDSKRESKRLRSPSTVSYVVETPCNLGDNSLKTFSHTPTLLSRLGSRSSSDLRSSVPTPTRVRRNSESATTAPWPSVPQSYPLSLSVGTQSTPDIPGTGNAEAQLCSSSSVESALPLNQDSFDFLLPVSEDVLASAIQPLNTNNTIDAFYDSFFDLNFSDPAALDFDTPIESVLQGWDFFTNNSLQDFDSLPKLGSESLTVPSPVVSSVTSSLASISTCDHHTATKPSENTLTMSVLEPTYHLRSLNASDFLFNLSS